MLTKTQQNTLLEALISLMIGHSRTILSMTLNVRILIYCKQKPLAQ